MRASRVTRLPTVALLLYPLHLISSVESDSGGHLLPYSLIHTNEEDPVLDPLTVAGIAYLHQPEEKVSTPSYEEVERDGIGYLRTESEVSMGYSPATRY